MPAKFLPSIAGLCWLRRFHSDLASLRCSDRLPLLDSDLASLRSLLQHLAQSPEMIHWRERGRMRELGFRMGGGGDSRMDGWTERWTDGRTNGRPDGRMDGRMEGSGRTAGKPSRAGKTDWTGGRVGGGRTRTGCPSMNAARGRGPKNARSTEIRRSLSPSCTYTQGPTIHKIGN